MADNSITFNRTGDGAFQAAPDWNSYYRRVLENPTARPEAVAEARRNLGLSPDTPPSTATVGAQSPMPSQPSVDNSDPMTKFNMAILDMMKRAQGGAGNENLYKQQTALQRAAIDRTSQVTPESLRVLSPGQQDAIRSGNVKALEPEIDAISAKIKANDSRLSNFEQMLGTIKEMGSEMIKINPTPEVVKGYVEMMRKGGDVTAIPDEIRSKVVGSMTSEDWAANRAALLEYKTASASGGGSGGGLTPYQTISTRNQIEDNLRMNPSVVSYGQLVNFGVPTVLERFKNGQTDSVADTILMRTLAKVTDPTTGVREEEYRTFEDAQGAINKVFTMPKSWVGEGRLTNEGRAQMIREIQERFEAREKDYTSTYDYYNNQAGQMGLTVPPPYAASGNTIKVRVKSTGQTGTIPANEFDPNIYEKI